jgi:hypothetical protein
MSSFVVVVFYAMKVSHLVDEYFNDLESKITNVQHLKEDYTMSVLDNWDQWKDFLGDRLHQAEDAGMNKQVVNDLAYQIGEYLAQQVQPKNDQEKVLADLWSVASDQEQHAIASMMVKLVQNDGTR